MKGETSTRSCIGYQYHGILGGHSTLSAYLSHLTVLLFFPPKSLEKRWVRWERERAARKNVRAIEYAGERGANTRPARRPPLLLELFCSQSYQPFPLQGWLPYAQRVACVFGKKSSDTRVRFSVRSRFHLFAPVAPSGRKGGKLEHSENATF